MCPANMKASVGVYMVRGADRPGAHAMTQGRPYARQRSTNWSIEFKFKRKYTDASISQQLQTLQHAKVAGGIKNLTPWDRNALTK